MLKKIFLISIIVSYSLYSFYSEKKRFDKKLNSILSEKGSVRVLVKIYVPDINKLIRFSTKFKSGFLKKEDRMSMEEADYNLRSGIKKSAQSVLKSLDKSDYTLVYISKTTPYISIIVDELSLNKLDENPSVLKITHDKPVGIRRSKKNK